MTQTESDDRFERRELLLHLGEMLDAVHRLNASGRPDAPVIELARDEAALRRLPYLAALAPDVTASEFGQRVAHAFRSWPDALLATPLDRDALARDVRRALFDGNVDGWNAYAAHLRKKVAWFANGVDADHGIDMRARASEPERPQKKGWPWPEPRT